MNRVPGSPERQGQRNILPDQGDVRADRAVARAAEQGFQQQGLGQQLFPGAPKSVTQNTGHLIPRANTNMRHGGKSKRKTNKGRTKKNKRKSSKRSKRA
jgi:hypothetical protein